MCVVPKVRCKLQSNIQRDKLATQKMLQAKIGRDVNEADSSGRRNKAGEEKKKLSLCLLILLRSEHLEISAIGFFRTSCLRGSFVKGFK